MRKFETISVTNTIGQWVDAYNNNALAASDHTWYLGEMLYNGILYTGLETIGGEKIASLVNTPINHVSPQNVELDNFYLYFRDVNKVLLVDQVTFDLRPYATGHPMYFYINSELGFRCDSEFKQEKNEICLFRFILSKGEVFQQCYITAQRFGSNVYDTADEFFLVKGCVPTCYEGLQIKFGNGTIKRSGIKFDNHQMPDLLEIEDKPKPFNIRYIENDNTVNFSKDPVKVLDPSEYLDYNSHTFKTVPKDKFSIQRILYDPYTDCIIMQYGNMLFSDMQSALTSINNVDFPFPYDTLMFIPMGIAIMSGECKDLSDINNCMLVQQLSTTINPQDSVFFAEDSYARGRLDALRNDIEQLQAQIDALRAEISGDDMDSEDLGDEFADDELDAEMDDAEEFGDEEAEFDGESEIEGDEDFGAEDEFDAEDEFESGEDFDSSEDFDSEDEEAIMESKRRRMNSIVESVVNSILSEDELHDFGKHPGYRKKPMDLPSTGEDKNQWGEDWNDESVHSEEPFGSKIGDSTPYEKAVEAISNKVMSKLAEAVKLNKKKVK